MFENIWEEKKIMDDDTKVPHVVITFRNHALNLFMILAMNIPQVEPKTIIYANKSLINEFQWPSLED